MQTIDPFSYHCGVIDCCNEMVAAGVKALAISHPFDTCGERDALISYANDLCRKYGTKLYPEDDLLLTDLFPVSHSRDKFVILFYREDHIIEEYLRLKERKAAMRVSGAYFGGNRTQIAWSLGRLLSYSDDAVRRLVSENSDKEQI